MPLLDRQRLTRIVVKMTHLDGTVKKHNSTIIRENDFWSWYDANEKTNDWIGEQRRLGYTTVSYKEETFDALA